MRHLIFLSLFLPGAASAWPGSGDWVAVINGGPMADVGNDVTGADGSLDLIGDTGDAALQWYADADDVFFRLRVAGDPRPGSMFNAFTWGVMVDIDGDGADFEYVIASSGATAVLEAYENTGDVAGTEPAFGDYTHVGLFDQTDAVRRDEDGVAFFVDLRVSRTELDTLVGIGDVDTLRFVPFTGSSVYAARTDLAGCDNNGTCTDLASVLGTTVYIDRDEDGLTDPMEGLVGADANDADSDDDGIIDGLEALGDADGDLIVDVLDCDSDADGILDGTEWGVISADLGVDTNLAAGCFVPDLDTVATPTNPYGWDTDQGGLADGIEDWNHNGRIDPPWELDPNDPSDDTDSDGDNIADVLELLGNDADVTDVDSDGDGIADVVEWLYDTDSDGIPNFLDTDSDGDGIDDAIEGTGDADRDGVRNYLDDDSDGDGIPDAVEGVVDSDTDGDSDFLDEDSDGDGIEDIVEGADDTDSDGAPDYLDDDSDSDGIPDADEGDGDPDRDGLGNFEDTDSDGDGLSDKVEGDDDVDEDGNPNYTDTNSDGDGWLDETELDGDIDCDGIPNFVDDADDDHNCDEVDTPDVDDQFDPVTDDRDDVFGQGKFTGGACSMVPGGALGTPGLLGLLTVFWRRRRAAALLAVAPMAAAQDAGVNAQRFAPSVDGQTFVKLEDDRLSDAGEWGVGAWANYADDPFVYRPNNPDVEEVEILGETFTTDLTGFYSFGDVRLGLDVPVHLYNEGWQVDRATNLGDMRLSGKARLPLELPVGLGAFLDASLPTGAADHWVGADRTVVRGGVLGTWEKNGLLAAANVGAKTGTQRELGDLRVSPGIGYGLGLGYALTDATSVGGEVEGEYWTGNAGQSGKAPMEWLGSVRTRATETVQARFGVGSGLTQGVGAPDFRVVAGVSFRPGDRSGKTDSATVESAATPTETAIPEPVPSAVGLGKLVVHAISPAGDPVRGAEIRVIGTLGGPMKTGEDGILEAELIPGPWKLTVAAPGWSAQTHNVYLREDETSEITMVLFPQEVMVANDKIYLHRKVFFELMKAELAVESMELLDDLVIKLDTRDDIALLRIEGHTDTTGTDAYNDALSRKRAQAVVDYLVAQGVEPHRLEAVGMGERRPLQDGDSEWVHATNRRVEFHIVEQGTSR